METIKLLAKLGEYQYMERLIKYGELYLRPISDFTKMDSNNGIGDNYENMVSYSAPKAPTIKFIFENGEEFQLSKSARITYGEHSCIDPLIYCMSMIDFVKDRNIMTIKNPDNLNKLGSGYDTMVIILDCDQFIERIKKAIKSI